MTSTVSKLAEPRLVNVEAKSVAGLSETYRQNEMSRIGEQWHLFGPRIGKIPGQKSNVAYGVVFGKPGGGIEYITGVEVSATADAGDDLKRITVPAGKYAVFPHKGTVSTLSKSIDAIYQDWLPASGHKLADNPKFVERYGEKFDPGTGSGDIEIWVPLKT